MSLPRWPWNFFTPTLFSIVIQLNSIRIDSTSLFFSRLVHVFQPVDWDQSRICACHIINSPCRGRFEETRSSHLSERYDMKTMFLDQLIFTTYCWPRYALSPEQGRLHGGQVSKPGIYLILNWNLAELEICSQYIFQGQFSGWKVPSFQSRLLTRTAYRYWLRASLGKRINSERAGRRHNQVTILILPFQMIIGY